MDDAVRVTGPIVPDGVVDLRRRIRHAGAAAGCVVPAVLGLLSVVLLRHSDSTLRGLLGTALALGAAPCLLLTGGPLAPGATGLLLGVTTSVVLWCVVGTVAARRALRRIAVDWSDVRREWWWLALPVWTGVVVALVLVDLLLGGALA